MDCIRVNYRAYNFVTNEGLRYKYNIPYLVYAKYNVRNYIKTLAVLGRNSTDYMEYVIVI